MARVLAAMARKLTADIKAREAAARREYPQTMAAFDRVREIAVKNLIASKPDEAAKREEQYRLIRILDSVQSELSSLCGQGSAEIEKYIESLNPATTGNR